MRIRTRDDAAPVLEEPDDFKRFSLAAPGQADAGRLALLAAPLGVADGDGHVFVDPAALRALPGARSDDAAWSAALDGMLAYARSQGWADDEGRVRAHVEWADPTA